MCRNNLQLHEYIPKQYEDNDVVIGEIDDVTLRFIQNPVRSNIRLQYSYCTVRDDYSYSTRTVQYRTRVRCRVLEYWSTVRWISSFFCTRTRNI